MHFNCDSSLGKCEHELGEGRPVRGQVMQIGLVNTSNCGFSPRQHRLIK